MRIIFAALAAFFLFALLNFFVISNNKKDEAKVQRYTRIVSLAPSYTEVVDALGQSDRLVGVTSHCHLKGISQIGTFQDANFEVIMALKPDLILAVPHVMAQKLLKMLEEQNIAVFAMQPDSLADIKKINEEVARLLGVLPLGQKLNDELFQALKNADLRLKKALSA